MRVWMLTSVLGTLISRRVSDVFVGVNCLVFDALMGSPGSRFEEAPGLGPREPQRCYLWCEDCNLPEVQVQSGNVWVRVKGQGQAF